MEVEVRGALAHEHQLVLGEGLRVEALGGRVALVPAHRSRLHGLVDLLAARLDRRLPRPQRRHLAIPVLLGQHGHDVVAELGPVGRRRHGQAEVAMDVAVALLVGTVLVDGAADTHDADHERHPWRAKLRAHVADELGEQLAVRVVPAGLRAIGVHAAIDHVVPPLEPHESGQLVPLVGVIVGIDAPDVGQDTLDVVDHEPVVATGGLRLVGPDLRQVLALLLEPLQLRRAELERPGARRAEVGVQALAAPRGLDDQDRPVQALLHRDPERELGADLGPARRRAEAGGESTDPLLVRRADRRDPDALADARRAVGAAHVLEDRSRRRIERHHVERAYVRVPLHVGLPGEDEHLDGRFGRRRSGAERQGRGAAQPDREPCRHPVAPRAS